METRINTNKFRALCHSGGALGQGVCSKNRETTENEKIKKDGKGLVQSQGKGLVKRREQRCMLAPRARATGAAKDVFSIRVSMHWDAGTHMFSSQPAARSFRRSF